MLIHRDILKLAAAFASTKESGPYINGVHVTPHLVEGTDGHRLVQIKAERIPAEKYPVRNGSAAIAASACDVVVPKETITKAISATPKRERLPILSCVAVGEAEGKVNVFATDMDADFHASHESIGPFPNTQTIVSGHKPGASICVGAGLMADTFKALARLGPDTMVRLTLDERGPLRAVRFDCVVHGANDISVSGMIMPCRDKEREASR